METCPHNLSEQTLTLRQTPIMPFICHCSRCSGPYKFSHEALGKQLRCPRCGEIAVIAAPVSRGTAGPSLSTAVSPSPAPPLQRVAPPPIPSPPAPLPKKRILPLPVLLGGVGLLTIVAATILLFALFHRGGGEAWQEPIAQQTDPSDSGDRQNTDPKKAERPDGAEANPPEPANEKREPAGNTGGGEDRDVNDHEDGPPLLLQIHSLDRVFADLKILAAEANKSKEIEQIFKVFQTPDGKVGFPGIDSNRPWGAYARIEANAAFGGLVGLVPIRDEADFLRLLHMLQCSTSKNADGVYEVKHAQLPKTLGVRFANRYAYVAFEDFNVIKKENLVEPKKVFVRDENADVRLTFRLDRLPDELRRQALAGVQGAGPKAKAALPQANPIVHDASEKLLDLLSRFGTDLVQESRELSLSLRIDSSQQELVADLRFRAAEKSRLARSLASWQETASVFGDLNEGSPALRARIHFRLPEELRRILEPLAHEALEQTMREATDRDKHPEDERFVRAFEPTVAAGELDVAMFVNSQGRGKPARTVAGLKVVKGLELEKAFRELVGTLPPAERALFQFDVSRTAGTTIHRLSVQGKLPPQALAVFGANPFFYYAFRDDAVLFAAGDRAVESIGNVLASRSRQTPPALLELNVKHLLEVMPVPDKERDLASKVFTDANPGRVRLSLGGGSVLRLRLDLALVRFASEMGLVPLDPRMEVKQR